MKGKVIIVRGALGIGKSTISKQIASELGGVYISVDNFLEDSKELENMRQSGFVCELKF